MSYSPPCPIFLHHIPNTLQIARLSGAIVASPNCVLVMQHQFLGRMDGNIIERMVDMEGQQIDDSYQLRDDVFPNGVIRQEPVLAS